MLTEIPAFQDHHGASDLSGEPYLRKRPVLATNGDDNVSGAHHGKVPCLARARCYRVRKIPVLPPSILVGQDAYGRATGLCGPAGCGLHHARESATDEGPSPLGDEPADFACLLIETSRCGPRAYDCHVRPVRHRVG